MSGQLLNPTRPIGILGGTFDPVHNGHLRIALDLREQLNLDHVRLMPCAVPPHRGEPAASMELRCLMVAQSLEGEPGLVLDDREAQRDGPSYTVDTLVELRREFPDTPLCLILGTDGFAGIESWSRWEQVFELAHVIVAQRPGEMLPAGASEIAIKRHAGDVEELIETGRGRVLLAEVTQLDISSTRIRGMLAEGKSPRYLMPDPALHLIDRYRLYKN